MIHGIHTQPAAIRGASRPRLRFVTGFTVLIERLAIAVCAAVRGRPRAVSPAA